MTIANPVSDHVEVARYPRGQVGPSQPMRGPVADGGVIVAETAPGCWGPMITPHFRGGHECTLPALPLVARCAGGSAALASLAALG